MPDFEAPESQGQRAAADVRAGDRARGVAQGGVPPDLGAVARQIEGSKVLTRDLLARHS
ncbi:MAG TPA: hypothetical protein VEX15_10925 [Nocardioidaceae bacterium]|nr:hypothetical protein [Nocardioidaceae bacterium]